MSDTRLRAVIYARVSKEEQLEGYSIDAQIAACRKLCRDREWIIADELTEEGESGKTFTDRTRWQSVMQHAQAGAFDVLVCHKIDRFSRATILDSLQTLKDLKALGVSFISAGEPIDFTSSYGEFMLLAMLWFARQYLTNLSAEVTKGRRGRAESGRSNANRPPFGYRRNDDGDDEPDPQTRHLAASMFERYATGTYSDISIAYWLNAEGARTLDGNLFTSNAVRELLINPFYAGWVRYRGIREALTGHRTKRGETKLMRGLHEPLVTQAMFDRCAAIRKTRAYTAGRAPTERRSYLLKDIAHCAHCGGRMKCSHTNAGGLRYSCRARDHMIDCEATNVTVRETALVPQIEAKIASLKITDAIMDRVDDLAAMDEQAEHQQARRAEIVAEMKRMDYLFQKGRKSQRDYDRDMARLEAELELLEPLTPVTAEEASAEIGDLIDAWRAAGDDNAALHEILTTLFESAHVDALTGEIVRWTPRAEFAALFTGRVSQF